MKQFLSTTALVVALGFPAVTLAQTTAPAANAQAQQQQAQMPGFLSARGQADLYASELIGLDVYARRTPVDAAAPRGNAQMNADGTHGMSTIAVGDLDNMDNIGQINEIVLSSDGQVRALVIGVGGFLGMGEQDVAVTMDQVSFSSDPDDASRAYVLVNVGADRLQESPRYERTGMMTQTAARTGDGAMTATNTGDAAMRERTAFTAPELAREGYDRVAVTEVSADLLMGKTVYDVNDTSVGTVDDMILDDAGAVSHVIIDFGGFLGIGSSQVSVGFDELTILSTGDRSDVRIYIDATQEQVQAQPQYNATN